MILFCVEKGISSYDGRYRDFASDVAQCGTGLYTEIAGRFNAVTLSACNTFQEVIMFTMTVFFKAIDMKSR